MAQLSRLKSAEITNNLIANADDVNTELDQLLNESNAQDTRVTSIESGTITLTGVYTFNNTGNLAVTFTDGAKADTIDEVTDGNGVTIENVELSYGAIKPEIVGLTVLSVDVPNDQITFTIDHALYSAQPIKFSGSDIPAPLSTATTYYAKSIDADTIEVYTDAGLTSLVTLTDAGTGTIRLISDPVAPANGQIWNNNEDGHFYGYRSGVKKQFLLSGDVEGVPYYTRTGGASRAYDNRIFIEPFEMKNDANDGVVRVTTQTELKMKHPPHVWLFNNDGSTTIQEENYNNDMTITGSGYTWNTDNLDIDSSIATDYFSCPASRLSDIQTFTTLFWVNFNTLTSNSILGLTDNANAITSQMWVAQYSSGLLLRVVDSGGGYDTLTAPGGVLSTGTKYLIAVRYKKVGGTANNIASITYTSDGITWNETEKTDARLMRQNSACELRSRQRSGTAEKGQDAIWYRIEHHDGISMTQAELQAIYDAGSEAAVDTAGFGLNGIMQSPSNETGTLVSSGTTLTGTGTTFTNYQIGDVIFSEGQGRALATITDATNATIESAFDANLAAANFKIGGRAYGKTKYHAYAISNGVTDGLILTTRDKANGDTLPDLPSGYDKVRQLPTYYVQTTNGCLIPSKCAGGGGNPETEFLTEHTVAAATNVGLTNVLNGGTSTTIAQVDISDFVTADVDKVDVVLGNAHTLDVRTVLQSPDTPQQKWTTDLQDKQQQIFPMEPSTADEIEYSVSTGSIDLSIHTIRRKIA